MRDKVYNRQVKKELATAKESCKIGRTQLTEFRGVVVKDGLPSAPENYQSYEIIQDPFAKDRLILFVFQRVLSEEERDYFCRKVITAKSKKEIPRCYCMGNKSQVFSTLNRSFRKAV